MTLSINNKRLFYIYATISFVLMCVSNRVLYTRNIPDLLLLFIYILQVGFFFILCANSRTSTSIKMMMLCVGVIYVLLYIKHPDNNYFRAIASFAGFANIACVLLLSRLDKFKLLEFITNVLTCILAISVVCWTFRLMGYAFPVFEYVDLQDDMHHLNNCYVFYESTDILSVVFPRFRGIFIEPGQLATPCVFLFFACGAKIKDWKNAILLVCILLSFSLAGYVCLLIGLFLKYLFTKGKARIVYILGFVLFIGTLSFYGIKYTNSDDPFVSLIIERLEYDEELGFPGNNRTDYEFDTHFDQYIKSGKILFGMGDEIPTGYASWTNHASGIKKFFVNFGLLGIITMIVLTILLLKRNYCRQSLVFFIVIWLGFIVRDMLHTQFWLIIAILGFFNIKHIYLKDNNNTYNVILSHQ